MKPLFLLLTISIQVFAFSERYHLRNTIIHAQAITLEQQKNETYWSFPAYLGTHFISQYYLMLEWLNYPLKDLKLDRLKQILLRTQLKDGSWQAVAEKNLKTGDLNATIFNYWALKAMSTPMDSEFLIKAKAYILKKGGLEASSLLTRVFLCLFGNHSWQEISRIPFWFFSPSALLNSTMLAQWVSPHLMPIAYLRNQQVTKNLGEKFSLNELRLNSFKNEYKPTRINRNLESFVDKMVSAQQPQGSWGGYTLATLLSLAALEDYQKISPGKNYSVPIKRGRAFIDQLYFQSGESNYLGVTDDGRYWDTALITNALLESGYAKENLIRTTNYLAEKQTRGGGFPFGLDFEYAPDTDDTAETILALNAAKEHPEVVQKAVAWLKVMQNNDGGWGAFAKNNNGNFILEQFLKPFKDSVEFFDRSSPDVAGHILEALGGLGKNVSNSDTVAAAVEYLLNAQDETGAWQGRWGVNYLYGTGAAVVGMIRAQVPSDHESIRRAVRWLVSKQNIDGGFGESTESYLDREKMGVGLSTPTQTAWALLALVEGRERVAAKRAAQYLINEFQVKGKWIDESCVGTGHPKIIYMQYPSYAHAFPLLALSRYEAAIGSNRSH